MNLRDVEGAVLKGTFLNQSETCRLIKLAEQGDESAHQTLLTAHEDRLKRMVKSMLHPRLSARVDPSDVVQDAFAKAAPRLPQYLLDQPVAFYPWLRQIVKERLIDIHRKHVDADRRSINNEVRLEPNISGASAAHIANYLVSDESTPSSAASKREKIEQIKQAMQMLSTEDHELLTMRFFEQLNVAEISSVLSISESAARSRLRRMLERLGRLVQD